jgi:hypothetical protein
VAGSADWIWYTAIFASAQSPCASQSIVPLAPANPCVEYSASRSALRPIQRLPCASFFLRTFNFRYRSPAHFVEVFRTWYGPVHKAFAALPAEGAEALERDLVALLQGLNRAGERSLVVPSEYLEVVVTRR